MGYVVIADGASVRDPHDGATRREEMHHLYLSRGQELPEGVSDTAIKSLVEQGAIAETNSDDARLALAGMPRSSSMRRSGPSAIPLLGNEAEAVRAAQSAAQFPGGLAAPGSSQSESELSKLPMTSLVTFAKAFGIPVDDKATKGSLAKLIANGGKDPEDAGDRDALRAERDQRQIESAETHPGSGVVPHRVGGPDTSSGGGQKKSGGGQKKSEQKSGGRSSGQAAQPTSVSGSTESTAARSETSS